MKKQALLEVQGLKKYFSLPISKLGFSREHTLVKAVDDISFSIFPEETLGLVGESGCGKSTTLRTILGVYQATAGKILFEGSNFLKLKGRQLLEKRQNIQMIFQDPYASLNPRLRAEDLISEPLWVANHYKTKKYSAHYIQERVRFLMDKVELPYSSRIKYPHEFSGGQRQRIGIARALATQPKLILADEPVSGLDVSIQAQVLNLLKDLQKDLGISYLFIAHDLAVVQYLSHRIAVMYLGMIVETTKSQKLYKEAMHPYTQALMAAIPLPDPQKEKARQRFLLQGEIPSPSNKPDGCFFYSRCSKRMPICQHSRPALKKMQDDHEVACFLYHDEEHHQANQSSIVTEPTQ